MGAGLEFTTEDENGDPRRHTEALFDLNSEASGGSIARTVYPRPKIDE